ncbi:hypothetical protein HRbin36_02625 [bacterium HR36]|nr:hypothetical protein HRbin36_02625 [bacterium HR36]
MAAVLFISRVLLYAYGAIFGDYHSSAWRQVNKVLLDHSDENKCFVAVI